MCWELQARPMGRDECWKQKSVHVKVGTEDRLPIAHCVRGEKVKLCEIALE